jgi:hypothetical protein
MNKRELSEADIRTKFITPASTGTAEAPLQDPYQNTFLT